jgi:hypothetical protein
MVYSFLSHPEPGTDQHGKMEPGRHFSAQQPSHAIPATNAFIATASLATYTTDIYVLALRHCKTAK